MNDNRIISSSDLISYVTNLAENSNGNELYSVWKNVVSKIRRYNDRTDDIPMGARLAQNSKVVDYKNGVVLVETNHSGYIQYLRIYQKFILTGLKRELPSLKFNSLAFRIAGSKALLSESYENSLNTAQKEMQERTQKNEEILEKRNKRNQNSENSSNLPQELLDRLNRIKSDMLTNSKN